MSFVFKVVRTSLAFAKIFTIILKLKAQNWHEAVRKIMIFKNIFTIILTSKVQIWDVVLKHRGFCSIPKDFYNNLMFESTNMTLAFEEARKKCGIHNNVYDNFMHEHSKGAFCSDNDNLGIEKILCLFFMMKTKIVVLSVLMQQWGCSNSLFWKL